MIRILAQVLSSAQLDDICDRAALLTFEPGLSGWSAAHIKHNLQATASLETQSVSELIAAAVGAHAVFDLAARPKRMIGPLVSRYEPGHAYGMHMDDAVLDGTRADLAFTLFLSPPEAYAGGDLVIETSLGDEAYKLPAGGLVLYPATTLHRVEPVTRGVRLAAVGWVRSLIRDAHQRDLLFDLDMARRSLFEQHGKNRDSDLLDRCATNLLRLWCDD